MALVVSGPMMGFSGTVDGYTYSPQPNGTTVVKKKNSKSRKPPTPDQVSNNEDTKIWNNFMAPLKDFVKIGYDLEAKQHLQNPYNMMVKHSRKAAIQGSYPHRIIDYPQVLVTKGDLPLPKSVSVQLNSKGLTFNWSTELLAKITHYTDQVIMLAYFPELKEVRYVTAGAQRSTGKDVLNLEGIEKGYTVQVYISFTTDDRKAIADSLHLGQFNW